MKGARFDILRNPEYGTYNWKLQLPDASYVCKSARAAFSTFAEVTADARRFRKLMGIKAVIPRTVGPS
jgi:hypothetical protein